MLKKHIRAPLTLKADGAEGDVSAVVSVFGVIDSDNDVVVASAFTDGQAVPMVWSHDWSQPVGKGVIRVQPDRAVFEGRFFTDTTAGRDAYLTVKNMAELQEFSWGFAILESEPGEQDGRVVRFIKRTEVFEISPVLVGANRETGLLAIKAQGVGDGAEKCWGDFEPPEGSYEALAADLGEAFRERQLGPDGRGFVRVVATYAGRFVALLYRWDDDGDEPTYWNVPYSRGDSEAFTLGDPQQVEIQTSFVPTGKGLAFDDHSEHVRVAVSEWVHRTKAGAEIRLKEGRAISAARRARMATVSESLRTSAGEIDAMLEETAPPEKAADETGAQAQRVAVLRLRSEFDRGTARRARELGVSA